jgi:hypothetical protein
MLDDATPGEAADLPHCMWCSAELPSDHETVCSSCGATLIGENDSQVPGVTAIDAEAILKAGRAPKPRQRNRLMSWISGDYEADDEPAPPGSLAPPPPDVRREMLRLELEAQVANLQAEAGALAADEAVETGTSIAETDIGAALAAVSEAARSDAAHSEAPAAPPLAENAAPATEDQPPA